MAYREGTSFGNRPMLFGRNHHVALAGEHFYAGDSDAFAIAVSGPDGVPLRSIRRAGEPRPVARRELETAMRRATEDRAQTQQRLAEAIGHAVPAPDPADFVHRDTYPAFDRLLADADGNLWVRAYPAPESETRDWSVFDPDGRWLGDLRTPEGFEVYQIGGDYLLGRWEDEFDVHYVRVYGLEKP